MDRISAPTLPAYGTLEQSGFVAPDLKAGKLCMDEAIGFYNRCTEMRAAILAWRAESLLGGVCRALYDKYLGLGGDPHWEDTRPFRGTDVHKAWGDGLQVQLLKSGILLQAWSDAGVWARNEALSAMGRELGAKFDVSDLPLYGRIKKAYAEGSLIRQERLDGVPLIMQPIWDAGDKAPFRDALLVGLRVDRKAFSECIGRTCLALESLILCAVDKPNLASLSMVDAQMVLRDQGYSDASDWEPLCAEMRPSVLAAHWLE